MLSMKAMKEIPAQEVPKYLRKIGLNNFTGREIIIPHSLKDCCHKLE